MRFLNMVKKEAAPVKKAPIKVEARKPEAGKKEITKCPSKKNISITHKRPRKRLPIEY